MIRPRISLQIFYISSNQIITLFGRPQCQDLKDLNLLYSANYIFYNI